MTHYNDTTTSIVQIVHENEPGPEWRILLTRRPLPHPWTPPQQRTGYERWRATRSALYGGRIETLEGFDTDKDALRAAMAKWVAR